MYSGHALASSTIERPSRAEIVPIDTLSWLCASVERKWIVVGAHTCIASAVIADPHSCSHLIVAGHIGYPWTEEIIAVARKHENVYIDTSAYTAKRYPPELVTYMKSRSGRSKVMFGTNYPMVLHQQALEDLDRLGLDDEGRELFLAGNAKRVLALVAN
jgi:Amidohydrolase